MFNTPPSLGRPSSPIPFSSWPSQVHSSCMRFATGSWYPSRRPVQTDFPGGLVRGCVLGLASWVLAWNRFPWFSGYQAHTFTPPWIAYILTVNGFTYRRTGTCLFLRRPSSFLLLFPASAGFWWFFEYLNRFVQTGPTRVPILLLRNISSSPLFPSQPCFAIATTREWLVSFSWWNGAYQHFFPVRISFPASLPRQSSQPQEPAFLLGVYPNHLLPFSGSSPLLILVSAVLSGNHIFSPLRVGDWRFVLASALAALLCGVFWEMWNFYSLAKWVYHVPFVQRFHIFEMPILGFAGYLPFGLECSVVAEMNLRERKRLQGRQPREAWNIE